MRRNTLSLIILGIFTVIFFFRLFFPTLSIFMIPDFGQSDVLNLNLPLKYILSTSLKNLQWPVWTENLGNGFPILAEGQIGVFYIPNLLLFRFFPLVWAYNLNLVFAYFISAIGMYLFSRKLNLSEVASFLGAFIFTFSGFFAVHLNHFNLIQAASLLPLIFWAGIIIWQKPNFKNAVLLAFFVSQQFLSGHFYISFITIFGLSLFWLFYFVSGKKDLFKERIFFAVFSIVLFLGLSSMQLLPTVELWQLSQRQTGLDFSSVTNYPYPFEHLASFIFPYLFGNPAIGTYPPFNKDWGIFWENTAYVGILPLILVIFSLFLIKKRLVKIFLLILLISLLLVLGKNSPLYFIFTFFPFSLFRVPSKYLLLTVFAISLLSAITISYIMGKVTRRINALGLVIAAIILILLVIDEFKFSYYYPPNTPQNLWTSAPESATHLPKGVKTASSLAPFAWNEVFKTHGWQDFSPYVYFKNYLYPNYNIFYDLKSPDINTGGLIPRRMTLFKSFLGDIDLSEEKNLATLSATYRNTLNLFSVNYLISPYEINNTALVLTKTINPPSTVLKPVLIYKNEKARPRSYLAFDTQKLETLEELQIVLSSKFLPDNLVFLEDSTEVINNPTRKIQTVQIDQDFPDKLSIKASSDTDAILVLTDSYYPGWSAFLDGSKISLFPVNLVQKGIFFPKGNHRVEFSFVSSPFELGKKIAFFSIPIIFLAVFVSSLKLPRKEN